jgi:hypothetical protein
MLMKIYYETGETRTVCNLLSFTSASEYHLSLTWDPVRQ